MARLPAPSAAGRPADAIFSRTPTALPPPAGVGDVLHHRNMVVRWLADFPQGGNGQIDPPENHPGACNVFPWRIAGPGPAAASAYCQVGLQISRVRDGHERSGPQLFRLQAYNIAVFFVNPDKPPGARVNLSHSHRCLFKDSPKSLLALPSFCSAITRSVMFSGSPHQCRFPGLTQDNLCINVNIALGAIAQNDAVVRLQRVTACQTLAPRLRFNDSRSSGARIAKIFHNLDHNLAAASENAEKLF